MQPQSWVYIFKDSGAGGDGRLRINLRKVKDLVNNASILAIFSLKLCIFFAKFPPRYAIFSYYLFIIFDFFYFFLVFCNFFYFFSKYRLPPVLCNSGFCPFLKSNLDQI